MRRSQLSGVFTPGAVLLILCVSIGAVQPAFADEAEQKSTEAIENIVSESVELPSPESIEEIIVYGDKPLNALRREVYRAEENFFAVFNSFNDDDDYDVRCFYEIPSFTHIRRHVCRAKFVVDATSAEAARFLGNVGAPAVPAELVIQRKREQFREILEALVAEHPELVSALNGYTDTRQTLDFEKKRRLED